MVAQVTKMGSIIGHRVDYNGVGERPEASGTYQTQVLYLRDIPYPSLEGRMSPRAIRDFLREWREKCNTVKKSNESYML